MTDSDPYESGSEESHAGQSRASVKMVSAHVTVNS